MLFMAQHGGWSNCYSYQATNLQYCSARTRTLSKYFHGTFQIRSSPGCVYHSKLPGRDCMADCCL